MKIINKIQIYITAVMLSALLLSSCGKDSSASYNNDSSAVNVSSSVSDMASSRNAAAPAPFEPFTDYSFELRGETENYMIIIGRGEFSEDISLCVENNRYESKSFVITAPTGYEPSFPFDSMGASSVVNVIKNDIDSSYYPDIMQFTFYAAQEHTDSSMENITGPVSRFYMIDKSGELKEVNIVEYIEKKTDDGATETEKKVYDYLDKTQLYHSEPDKFIYEIKVDDLNLYSEDGEFIPVENRVKIRTLDFIPETQELVMGYEDIAENNPLYFGYAYWAAANSAAQYFTMTTLNVTDYENYIEEKSGDGTSQYFFKIDDSRFANEQELTDYLETIFSDATAERIMEEAPQKYHDINGELYGIVGDGVYYSNLGTLTFSGFEATHEKMIFRSRQEQYDDNGNFVGYTDGGNFVIAKQLDGIWRVIQYRYPYSAS